MNYIQPLYSKTTKWNLDKVINLGAWVGDTLKKILYRLLYTYIQVQISEDDIFINFPKNLDKPIETIIDGIIEEINPKISGSSTKLQRFVEEYNKEFGDDDRFDNSDFSSLN